MQKFGLYKRLIISNGYLDQQYKLVHIDFIASPNTALPKLPPKLTPNDVDLLERAIGENLGKKI